MEIITNINVPGSHGKPMMADIFYKENHVQKPVIIFCHGFKGYKDWGAWNTVARYYAQQGYVFVKFNFSYNGTTPDQPSEFADLEAFASNTFSIEMDDLGAVIDWIGITPLIPPGQMDLQQLYLLGHSRGGAIAILKAYEDERVKKLATWAAVSNFAHAWRDEKQLKEWRDKGISYVENKRTGQKMPVSYKLYEDLLENDDRLNIEKAVKNLHKPFLVIHGTEDATVPFEQALQMKYWNTAVKLDLIPQANHTFGITHPFEDHELPFEMKVALEHTDQFLKSE